MTIRHIGRHFFFLTTGFSTHMLFARQPCITSESWMLKLGSLAALLAGQFCMHCLGNALAAERVAVPPAITVQAGQGSAEPYMPIYKPRREGATTGRVDGGFRGGREGEPVLKVLAPFDHVGETLKKSPALYWYLSQVTSYPIRFTFEDPRLVKPMLEVGLAPPAKPGIQTIRLSDYGIELEPQIPYSCHLSLEVDEASPSKDIHAMGIIERIPYDQAIVEGRTSCRDSRDVFCLYVESGLWYDAIQVISDLISANPRDRVLRLQRASLLDKVGLVDVAEYDRTQGGP